MRAMASGVLVAALLAFGSSNSDGRATARGPLLLVTLPSLGTVTWSCDAAGRGAFALGYRASPRYATTDVVLRSSGRIVARRTIQPGERMRLPFLKARSQRLSFVQATEPGTLRASVTVDFGLSATAGYCRDYSPPGLVVHVSARRSF
jgi:hypothetical protein